MCPTPRVKGPSRRRAGPPRARERRLGRPWLSLGADRTHGATEIARRALRSLAPLVDSRDPVLTPREVTWLSEWVRQVPSAQPAMGVLQNFGDEIRGVLDPARSPRTRIHLREWQRRRLRSLEREEQELLQRARAIFPAGRSVITISHSTVVERLLRSLVAAQRPDRIWVLRSLPGGEGALLARRLRQAELPAHLVEDDRALWVMDPDSILLLGADTVYRDGSLLHKAGTRRLARAAHWLGVRAIVLATTSKFRDSNPPSRRTWSSTFDLTPGMWVPEVWTERGVWSPGTVLRTRAGTGWLPQRSPRPGERSRGKGPAR